MEGGKLGRAPDDLEVFQLAIRLSKTPDQIRRMSLRDRNWLKVVTEAERLAAEELAKRRPGKKDEAEKPPRKKGRG